MPELGPGRPLLQADVDAGRGRPPLQAFSCDGTKHRAPTIGCGSGLPTAPGRESSPPCSPRPTPRATSTGSSRSTPPSSALISTPPGPVKSAPADEPHDHALGRSRGGLTTKIHLAADSRCRPPAFVLTPGRAGDAPAFPEVMAQLRVSRPIGRPRTTPDVVLADKAYSSRAIRTHLRQRGIRTVIPQPADQAANRKRRGRLGGRPPAFDRDAYKQRNTVERCINKLKQWRGLATRYDKTATIYLAAIFIWSAK